MTTHTDAASAVRAHRAVVIGQLVLTAVAVGVARLGLGARTTMVLILAAATVSGGLVVWSALGLGRQWRPVYVVLAVMAIVGAGLLFWPAWGHYDRVRFH